MVGTLRFAHPTLWGVCGAWACVVAVQGLPAMAAIAADWKPERPIEIVVNTPPGNGPDRTARVMQAVLQDKKQVEPPIAVNNKLGGGGVVAYTYVNSKPGDAHTLIIASKALISNHIAGRGLSYTEFTPVVNLYSEYMVVVVKPDSRGKPHYHPAEQVSMFLRGGVRVSMHGTERIARAGAIVHIPGNAVHMFEILGEETEILDVYTVVNGVDDLKKRYPAPA